MSVLNGSYCRVLNVYHSSGWPDATLMTSPTLIHILYIATSTGIHISTLDETHSRYTLASAGDTQVGVEKKNNNTLSGAINRSIHLGFV